MAAKKKRKYTRRKKPTLSAASMQGYAEGVVFAQDNMAAPDAHDYLTGHAQGTMFVVENTPKKRAKKRAAYGSKKKASAKKKAAAKP